MLRVLFVSTPLWYEHSVPALHRRQQGHAGRFRERASCRSSRRPRGHRANHPLHGQRSSKLHDRKRGRRGWRLHGTVDAEDGPAAARDCGRRNIPQPTTALRGAKSGQTAEIQIGRMARPLQRPFVDRYGVLPCDLF